MLPAAAALAAGRHDTRFTERGKTMAAQKTTTKKKATSRKQVPAKKASTKKPASKKAPSKPAAGGKAAAKKAPQKMSALDAAAKLLSESKQPLRCREMIEQMAAKGYWKSPGGRTPAATLYAAITREINTKGQDARFKKMDRGLFAANK